MYSNALRKYETIDKQTMSGREVEAAVLTKAAKKLIECRNDWDAAHREGRLEEAIKFNQRIWSVFQAELMREENPLPNEIKVNIMRLSAVIDRRLFESLAYPSPEKLDIVIDINNNLAAGLRGSA